MNNPLPDLMELIQSSCSALLLPCKYKARGFSLSRYTICEERVLALIDAIWTLIVSDYN